LVTNRRLDLVTQRHICGLIRRLNLTESLVKRLVTGGLVGRELVVAGLVVRGGLFVARGLVGRLVGGSFVNRSRSS
jgi:hypothetical protein